MPIIYEAKASNHGPQIRVDCRSCPKVDGATYLIYTHHSVRNVDLDWAIGHAEFHEEHYPDHLVVIALIYPLDGNFKA